MVSYTPRLKEYRPFKKFNRQPKTLGDWLHVKRFEADLTRTQLALKLGITLRSIINWEKDLERPNTKEWALLSTALRLDDVPLKTK